MLRAFGEPEDEFVVHEVCARVPPLAEKTGGADRKPSILELDLSPVRLHRGECV
jgi:hypothetical protein